MFHALTHELSIDDALDLDEIDGVSRSWRDAAQANAEDAPPRPSAPRARRFAR
jgi:hypothetical protein